MYQTWLIPYLEGTLDAEQRRQIEARLADDPVLASELDTLRQTEPRLRQSIARLKGAEAATALPAPLWPRLRDRLDARHTRPQLRPFFWWGGGLCAASALVLAVIFSASLHSPRPLRLADSESQQPAIIIRRNNSVGTRMAQKLRAQAVRVAAQTQATRPHPDVGLAPSPQVAAASPTKSTPLPPARTLPRPAMPPVQVAARESSEMPSPLELPPAPAHSPAQSSTNRLVRPSEESAHSNGPAVAAAPQRTSAQASGGFGGGGFPGPTDKGPQMDASPPSLGGAGGIAALAPQSNRTNSAAVPPQKPRFFAKTAPRAQELAGGISINGSGNVPMAPAPPILLHRLMRTLTPPLYGTTEGEAEEERLLTDARRGEQMPALRAALAQRSRTPSVRSDAEAAASGRLRAALDEADGEWERAALERRRIVHLPSAVAEDWYTLARMEALLGNAAAARRAYTQALRAVPPLSTEHRSLARQNSL